MRLYSLARATALGALCLGACTFPSPMNLDIRDERLEVRSRAEGAGNMNRNVQQGCSHGPGNRACWDGCYSIQSDPDFEWPNTGNIVKVG